MTNKAFINWGIGYKLINGHVSASFQLVGHVKLALRRRRERVAMGVGTGDSEARQALVRRGCRAASLQQRVHALALHVSESNGHTSPHLHSNSYGT